ncbi:hypothetical protein BJV78DRAFT_1156206 [Lactifluus subvellereus]|nr:hypothetical protein BJV78DRAFT_1156206 [Lactifluus subvellereus]
MSVGQHLLFFIYDEFTDKVDGDGARVYAAMAMDAIRNPHKECPQGEPRLGEIARQFWLRAIKISSLAAQKLFIATFAEYLYAVIEETSDRANLKGHVRGIDDSEAHAAQLADVYLFWLRPGHVTYSYNIEQAAGHGGHDIVTVVMNEKVFTACYSNCKRAVLETFHHTIREYVYAVMGEADDRAQGHIRGILRRLTIGGYPSFLFLELGPDIPDEVMEHPAIKVTPQLDHGDYFARYFYDDDMYSYNVEQARGCDSHSIITVMVKEKGVDLDRFWIRGHDCWSFESERYFGAGWAKIQRVKKPKVTAAHMIGSQRIFKLWKIN